MPNDLPERGGPNTVHNPDVQMNNMSWFIKKPSKSSKSHWYVEILAWEVFLLAAHLCEFKAGEPLSNLSSQEGP